MKKYFPLLLTFLIGASMFAPIFSMGVEGPPISFMRIMGSDEINFVDIVLRGDGKWAIATDSAISSVNVPNGRDPVPDNFFRIIDTGTVAGAATITVAVKGTLNDPSTPDDDVPDYSKVFTILIGEEGDERKLRDRIIQELNADSTFKNTVFLKAQKAKNRRIVHIFSKKFSLVGEFYARQNTNDFLITAGGDASTFQPDTLLISRTKETSLTQDPDNPHKLGRQGFFGDVTVTSGAVADLFISNAMNGGSVDLRVDGSVTPVNFRIECDATEDIFIRELRFYVGCNGLKYGQHLCTGGALTNGVEVSIQSDELPFSLPLYTKTEDYKNKFAFGSGANFRFDDVAGTDQMLAVLILENPFVIRVCGSFTADDFLQVKIQDDLSSGLQEFEFLAFGFRKEP